MRFAIERRALFAAEEAARELGRLSVDDALALVYLCGEVESRKYEAAAKRWLERYIAESKPTLLEVAHMAALLAEPVPRQS